MHVTIRDTEGQLSHYFGISDIQTNRERGETKSTQSDEGSEYEKLYLHYFNGVDGHNKEVVTGEIVSSVSEAGYNERGAYEAIGSASVSENEEVIIGVVGRFPQVTRAVLKLRDEEDFEGDLTILNAPEQEAI